MNKSVLLMIFALGTQAWGQEVFQPHPKTSLLGGLTTASRITRTPTALSLGYAISDQQWLEWHLGLASGAGTTTFGVAGQFKSNISGDSRQGLHLGGSLGLGSFAGNFFATLGGIAGLHFAFPALERLFLVLDAGPVLTIGASADLSIAPVSAALGLSLFYRI